MDWFFYDRGLRHERIKVFTSKPLLFFFSITKIGVFILFWKHAFIRMKISSLLNRVLGVLACSRAWRAYVLACSRAWRAYVLACSRAWRACLLTCLRTWRAYVLACSRAWRACVLTCLGAHVLGVLACSRTYVLGVLTCLRAYVLGVLACLCVHALLTCFLWCMLCVFTINLLTFLSNYLFCLHKSRLCN